MAVKLTGVQETTVNVGTVAQVHINVEPWPTHTRDVMIAIKSDTRFDTWFGHGPFDPTAQIVVTTPPFSLTLNILAKTGTPAGTYIIAIEAVNPANRTGFLSELNIKVNVKSRERRPPPVPVPPVPIPVPVPPRPPHGNLYLSIITEPQFTASAVGYHPYEVYSGRLWRFQDPVTGFIEHPITRNVFPATAGRGPGPAGLPGATPGTFLIPLIMEPIRPGRYRIELPAEFREGDQVYRFLSIAPHVPVHFEEGERLIPVPSRWGPNPAGGPPIPIEWTMERRREHIVVAIFDDIEHHAVRERLATGEYRHVKITAVYSASKEAVHKGARVVSSSTAGAYGVGGTSRLGRAAGMGTQLASMKWSENVEVKNVALTAAVNTGRKELHDYGEYLYNRLFLSPARGLVSRFQRRLDELRQLERNARDARRTVRRIVSQQTGQHGGFLGTGLFGAGLQKLLGATEQLLEGTHGMDPATEQALRDAASTMNEYYKTRDEYARDFENELDKVSATLRDQLMERAGIIATTLSRKYKIPLRSDTQQQLKAQLEEYAQRLSEELITRGSTRLQAFFRGLRIISREGQGVKEVWQNILANLWGFVTGPWVLGAAALFVMYMEIISWSGELSTLVIMGIIGAIGVFLLNFEEVKYPLDWLTHMIAGGMIGAGTGLFLLALFRPFIPGFPGNMDLGPFSGQFMFFVLWFFIAFFIGAFQFYHPPGREGYRVIFQMTIITIVFAYVALGPYNGYYKATMKPIGSVVITGFNTVKNAFLDVWLLGTNPTEWYARQQLKNVRAEKPLDFPKGIEIEDIVVIPDSVPASDSERESEFGVFITFVNHGDLTAEDVSFEIECNEYAYAVTQKPPDKCKSGYVLSGDVKTKLEPGEGGRVQFSNLHAYKPEAGRSVEFQLAKVKVTVKYAYKTSSSLNVEVMNKDEINRRQFSQQTVYHTVTATSKATPAELSLNVGPQPLAAGSKNNLLAVSVLNARSDGKVVLPAGTEIKLTAPKTIISKLVCRGCESTQDDGDKLTTTCIVPKEREIKYSEFKSIFAFLCDIDTKNQTISRSDIITAEMPKFFFKVQRSKDVAITPPLGIIPTDKPGGKLSGSSAKCDAGVISTSQQEGYNTYKTAIDKAAADYDFKGSNGHAAIAAIVSKECGSWDSKCVRCENNLEAIWESEVQRLGCQQYGCDETIDYDGKTYHKISCSYGLAQTIYATAWGLGYRGKPEGLYDAGTSIDLLAKYFTTQLKDCNGNLEGAAANYNAGGGNGCNPTSYSSNYVQTYSKWQSCIQFSKIAYAWPTEKKGISGYCFDEPTSEALDGTHDGIDIGYADIFDKPVKSTANGKVEKICEENCSGYGKHVIIRHDDGRSSLYAHLNSVSVNKDQSVEKGKTPIGKVGNTGKVFDLNGNPPSGPDDHTTGVHLHLEIRDQSGNLVNPCNFLDCSGTKCSSTYDSKFCENKIKGAKGLCTLGEGGCSSDQQCQLSIDKKDNDGDGIVTGLHCKSVQNMKLCCYEDQTEVECLVERK